MRPLVLPLTWGYAAVIRMRRYAYEHGWLPVTPTPQNCVVISIGGLEAGGTGKTPTTGYVLGCLQAAGVAVGLVSRGYGRQCQQMVIRRPGEAAEPHLLGDEPAMLVASGHDVAVAACAKRADGVAALAALGTQICVLDDAFAHRACQRDLDIVTLCGEAPFGNGHLLPWGNLREPISALERADVLWLNFRQSSPSQNTLAEFQARYPEKLIVAAELGQAAPIDQAGRQRTLAGAKLLLAAAIARPGVFYRQVQQAGADIRGFHVFPDHHAFCRRDLRTLEQAASACGAEAIVVTAKDAIKLNTLTRLPNLWVVDTQMTLLYGEQELKKKLGNLLI